MQGICGPGLTCKVENQAASCVKMTDFSRSDCLAKQAEYDLNLETGSLGMDQRRPECDAEGDWAPVQCTGAGLCRCVSKVSPGLQIYRDSLPLRTPAHPSSVWRPTSRPWTG